MTSTDPHHGPIRPLFQVMFAFITVVTLAGLTTERPGEYLLVWIAATTTLLLAVLFERCSIMNWSDTDD